MTPQYASRIFGLFKRRHKDEFPGTGLGLAICQRIVEGYSGRMFAGAGGGAMRIFDIRRAEDRLLQRSDYVIQYSSLNLIIVLGGCVFDSSARIA